MPGCLDAGRIGLDWKCLDAWMLAGLDWIGSEWLLDRRQWLDGVDGETSHTLELPGSLQSCRGWRLEAGWLAGWLAGLDWIGPEWLLDGRC